VPRTPVILYRDDDGMVPLLKWLAGLPDKARLKCRMRIKRLNEMGHDLRRPEADYLRDGIHELRVGFQDANFRILYFFFGNIAALLCHEIVKEDLVPDREIVRALARKSKFENSPERHTAEEL
jgi:phage-related protein